MRSAFFVAVILTAVQTTSAQVAVQQPVIGQTSVSTTVSVPDRGSTLLGGTTSAQAGRSQFGPLRSGTSSGVTYQSSSISTHVTIHDLRAMDEDLLRSGAKADDKMSRDGLVSQIQKKRERREFEIEDGTVQVEKAAKFERLAVTAEKSGKPGAAKLFWQSAAQCGSTRAEKRLAELNRQPTSSPVVSAVRGDRSK